MSRQRSCQCCARSKRKCDLQLPACGRCSLRGYHCEYATSIALPGQALSASFATMITPSEVSDVAWFEEFMATPQSMGLIMPPSPTASRAPRVCTVYVYHPGKTGPRDTSICEDSLNFASKAIKRMPFNFLRDLQLPFLHADLYFNPKPRTIRILYNNCKLYAHRSAQDEGMAAAAINDEVDRLALVIPSATKGEKLEALQALIIYQIIRLFNENIRQRALAESQQGLIESLCLMLRGERITRPVTTISDWRDWIFWESYQRSLFFALFVNLVYELLKSGEQCQVKIYHSELTIASSLWYAQTLAEFKNAQDSVRGLVLESAKTPFEYGSADEMDDLGMLMYVCSKGYRSARELFGSRLETCL